MPVHRQKTDDDEMVWPPDNFTGEWIVEWSNGQVKFQALYLNGKAEGDYLCYWSNGNFAQKGYCEDGKYIGIWSDYWEDGTKFKETEYFSPGNYDVRWLKDGEIKEIEVVRVGRESRVQKL